MKNHESMTRDEFLSLPHREWDQEILCDSIVIIPSEEKHDSGYLCLDFAAIVNGEATVLLSGSSDLIKIDCIGGYGDRWLEKYNSVPVKIPVSGWSIDCLPVSGLLRMWPNHTKQIRVGPTLSSLEIFAVPRKEVIEQTN